MQLKVKINYTKLYIIYVIKMFFTFIKEFSSQSYECVCVYATLQKCNLMMFKI